ncbi:hypothetical protein [Streptomyces sp. NBC_01481]|uniref:hypothetical protein n=1 Tax=Streptomyces sp. NBC_01481 TaxID=2975869 RepID=UPI002255B77C|nr:hypothetical protein [Streptomyces sp. NBC_01481]MCX4584939.1 hypothetical protein [Streptomyces sp. NBC_01481]
MSILDGALDAANYGAALLEDKAPGAGPPLGADGQSATMDGMTTIGGEVAAGFEPVREAFAENRPGAGRPDAVGV